MSSNMNQNSLQEVKIMGYFSGHVIDMELTHGREAVGYFATLQVFCKHFVNLALALTKQMPCIRTLFNFSK